MTHGVVGAPIKVAATALANEVARVAWAMMVRGERYKEPVALAWPAALRAAFKGRTQVCPTKVTAYVKKVLAKAGAVQTWHNLNKFNVTVLKPEASEPSGCISTSVDVDSIRSDLWLLHGRMPVHNDLAEVLFRYEKFSPNP